MRRALWIHERLGNAIHANANTLAAELEVTARTIKRDIDELRDVYKAPIEWEPSTKTYFYTEPFDTFPLLRLTADEALALELAGKTFSAWAGSPLGRALTSAFGKIGELAGGAVSVPANQLTTCVSAIPEGDDMERRNFAVLLDAIRLRNEVDLAYAKPGAAGIEHRTVHPVHLAYLNHGWVLVAYDPARRDHRKFLLTRVRQIEVTGDRFPPQDFDVREYLANSFGRFTGTDSFEVRIRFDALAAGYIREQTWHPSQTLLENADGTIEVKLTVNHLVEVQRWILSWGSHAEALAPAELRTAIASEIARLTTHYKRAPQIPHGR